MKNILKLGFTLAAYATVACVSLAFVYNVTAPAIERVKQEKAGAGMKIVFEQADSFVPVRNFERDSANPIAINALYTAEKGGKVLGAVVEAAGPTYDKATMLIGLDLNRTITGIQFLSLTDTPGFGQRANEPEFLNRFKNLNAEKTLEAGKDFDGLSGATITTKGVTNIVNYAVWVAGNYLAANHGGKAGSGAAPAAPKKAAAFDFESAFAELFPATEGSSAPSYTEIPGMQAKTVQKIRIDNMWSVSSDGKTIGIMVAATGASYHGTASVLTAVDMERNIIGARITDLNDTPNIGQRALEEDFYNQFAGKSADANLLVKDGLDALSGATITSASIADIVKVSAVEAASQAAAQGGKAAPAGSGEYALNGLEMEE
ncbi:FMN-binding protein [Treponema maltophilum]|uniref:FMN-binding protein n=1 Tax=Treponema maltophilum TaxID=51160 RepID=UPI003D916ADB